VTEPDGVTPDEPVDEIAAEPHTEAGDNDDTAEVEKTEEPVEGPRRRERRERAERREAQARAIAIEQARREAKRAARGHGPADPKPVARGAVRGLNLVLLSLLLVVAITGVGLILYFTPLMSARGIIVNGLGAVTRDEVLDAAHVKLGTPLLQINTDGIADRVAAIRRVASAHVQRDYPSALMITVVERVPVVVKDLTDGPHLFDRDGVDFATGPPPPGLPYIDVDNPGPADPATKAALAVLTALRPEVVGQVSRIAAPSVASITLTLTDGRTVIWGTNDRTEEKAQKLAALLTRPGRTYDVSSPDLPTIR
jgi:cell division protein FtsQ